MFEDYSLVDMYDKRLKDIISRDAKTPHERRLNCRIGNGLLYSILPSAKRLDELPYKYTPKCKPSNTVATREDICNFLKNPPQSHRQLQSLENLESLQRLESLESLERLQSLERLESLQRLESFRKSYDEIEIKPDSVIYCDIPYRNTDEYGEGGFDYEKFYSWAERQTEPVFISEYAMPEDRFVCVNDISKRVLLCSGSGHSNTEKLFVPKSQIEMLKERKLIKPKIVQLSLFDEEELYA